MKQLISATALALILGACSGENEAQKRAEEQAAIEALERQREEVIQSMEMRWEARSEGDDEVAEPPE